MDKISNVCTKKNAFTLAEVVITIVAVGIITLLVFPPLMRNYQKQELYNRFIHSYTELENLLPKLIREMGPVWKWSDEDCTNIVDYMKVIKECEVETDCFAEKYQTIISSSRKVDTSSALYRLYNKPSRTVELADGSVIKAQIVAPYDNRENIRRDINLACFINIDTNGKKGPNILGRDLFRLKYLAFGQISPHPTATSWDRNGFTDVTGSARYYRDSNVTLPTDRVKSGQDIHSSGLREFCVDHTSGYSNFCVYLLLREGKMDY